MGLRVNIDQTYGQHNELMYWLSFDEQAITEEGDDPNEYIFETDDKGKPPVKRARNESKSSNTNETQVILFKHLLMDLYWRW